jgi:hypothetical protein
MPMPITAGSQTARRCDSIPSDLPRNRIVCSSRTRSQVAACFESRPVSPAICSMFEPWTAGFEHRPALPVAIAFACSLAP